MKGTYSTVGDVIRGVLPEGTSNDTEEADWSDCPVWAPDLFAVCATLARLSGCYAEPGLILSRNAAERRQKIQRAKIAAETGLRWANDFAVPSIVERFWSTLMKADDQLLCSGTAKGKIWKRAALQLLAIADETCAGAGYEPEKHAKKDSISEFVLRQLIAQSRGRTVSLELPHSLTYMVPADVCCVLPKAMTPEVGCTLRSLSHHLALLPALGEVQAEWYIGDSRAMRTRALEKIRSRHPSISAQDTSLNLLLIPFPFVVRSSDFEATRRPEKGVDGYFKLNQDWLFDGKKKITAGEMAKFVIGLIETAEREVSPIQGIVFPEAALSRRLAIDLTRILAKQCPGLELLICGAISADRQSTRNEAIVFRIRGGDLVSFEQSKHHRWRLDGRQILQYHLGGSLDPKFSWWEQIDVHDRTLRFTVDGHEAVIAALVCEDLARHEPVLPAISAIGPSLLVALLMDGPQLEARWSGRYATVLADDPGSSVLTLTCLGMIRRSRPPGTSHDAVIGIWKDREGRAKELILPDKSHGLVLCLTSKSTEQRTLDLRSDGGNVVEYRLSGVQPIVLKTPPPWLERDR